MGVLPDVEYVKVRRFVSRLVVSLLLLLLSVTMVFPLLFMLSSSFKSNAEVFARPLEFFPREIYLQNYSRIFHH